MDVPETGSCHAEWFLQDYGRPPIDEVPPRETPNTQQPERRPSPIPESALKRPTLQKRHHSSQPSISLPLRPVIAPGPTKTNYVPCPPQLLLRQPGRSGADQAQGIQGRGSRSENSAPQIHFKSSPGKIGEGQSHRQSGQQRPPTITDSDELLKLPVEFFKLTVARRGSDDSKTRHRQTPLPSRAGIYDDIRKATRAIIRETAHSPNQVLLRGDLGSIARAKALLLNKVETITKTAHGYTPVDDRIVLQAQKASAALLALRKEPPVHIVVCKLIFYWPRDGPTIKTCFGDELEELDFLRKKYSVHIYIQTELDHHICFASDRKFDKSTITNIIRRLWTHHFARSQIKTKLYMIQPPEPNTQGDRIFIAKNNGVAQANIFRYQSNQSPGHFEASRHETSNLLAMNQRNMCDNLDRCVRTMKHIDCDMRICVKFGTFILDRWKTINGVSQYPLQEFPEMLLDERWQGRLVPGHIVPVLMKTMEPFSLNLPQTVLLRRFKNSGDFLELKDATKVLASLETVKVRQSVAFEFVHSQYAKNRLSLNVEFSQNPGAIESGSAQHYWFQTPVAGTRQSPPMQLSMMDFERTDWEIELKFLEPMAEDDISEAQRKFAASVKLDPMYRGALITSKPERRTFFQDNVSISRFVQKSSLQFKIKRTKYILELARFEEFQYFTAGRARLAPPKVRWGARLTNLLWEHLLSDWHERPNDLTFNSLFPGDERKGPNKDNPSVQEFLRIVKQVAILLGPQPQPYDKMPNDPDEEDANSSGVLESELGILF
ncbi:hypothetical protein VI817_006449 [Penicillium citrinum]|nr:hypothetical protein VI817_006449 [Penicillium citrinum]